MAVNHERVNIVVLEHDNNKKGDLFGRAMCDLFHALGYEDFSLNISKSGREIDIKGKHRTEQRCLLAECKATKGAIGGSDTNKFAGAVAVENARSPERVYTSYFASLGGFSATAREQEEEAGGQRMVLLDSDRIVGELIKGKVIAPRHEAASIAGRCADLPEQAKLGDRCIVLIHEIGWLWAFYFKTGGRYSHFTVIHADGHSLHRDLAEAVIDADAQSARLFAGLEYVYNEDLAGSESAKEEARREYFSYLEREFGAITLEGLPADQETGSKSIRLESIYIPLHLAPVTPKEELSEESGPAFQGARKPPRIPVAEVLGSSRHIAILAAPGGGKTTLLKRLAIAYAISDRRDKVGDELPAEDWFPVFLRCRQLREMARKPITEIIHGLLKQAERPDLSQAFSRAVGEALKAGKVLLLVDGLDEISDAGDRVAFAAQLRTFIGTYPTVRVVVTSREAGFRAVSGAMSSACSLYKISDLSTRDIFTLCRAWHHEVTRGTTETADQLARSIINKPRVRELAINPLLLTTLLLVQRWLGELPPKRSALYDKAIEVLLMTWNTEGHTPIDQDEAMPRLAYAAFSMMKERQQAISAKGLKDLFDEAKANMPDVLGYARMSSTELIDRVEDRSSLLLQSGHILEDGSLRPLYEFKHLTFQEYLAAKACVESWNPMREVAHDCSDVLAPYLNDESWSEVVPLAAVLAGSRGARLVVESLIEGIEAFGGEEEPAAENVWTSTLFRNLVQCLVDEVQISPTLVRRAMNCVIIHMGLNEAQVAFEICQSRFATELPDVAWNGFVARDKNLMKYAGTIASCVLYRMADTPIKVEENILRLLDSSSPREVAEGIAGAMVVFFSLHLGEIRETSLDEDDAVEDASILYRSGAFPKSRIPGVDALGAIKDKVLRKFLEAENNEISLMAMWALVWLDEEVSWTDSEIYAAIHRLVEIWKRQQHIDEALLAAWAIWRIPLASKKVALDHAEGMRDFLLAEIETEKTSETFRSHSERAAQVISYYCGLTIPYGERESRRNGIDEKIWLDKFEKMTGSV